MKIWVSSDHHFTHHRILEYCNRPFSDTWEMDVAMSDAWNLRVSDNDVVLYLGDMTLINKPTKSPDTIERIKNLKGRKVFVKGNHDKIVPTYREWGWRVFKEIVAGDVLLIHIPPPKMPKGIGLVLHGHSHNGLKRDGYIDVGVDAQPNYAPVDLSTIVSEERFEAIGNKLMEFGIPNDRKPIIGSIIVDMGEFNGKKVYRIGS